MSDIERVSAWVLADVLPAKECAEFAQKVEGWGYRMLWIPEAFARNPMVSAAWILSHTRELAVATGIANIYARDSLAMLTAQYGLAEISGGRFLLGVGVSHRPMIEGMRGQEYRKPLGFMRDYLERMRDTEYQGPPPPERPKTVIGALGPKMLELSATHADGAHPYNVTPVHTAMAREILGPDKLLLPEQVLLRHTDASEARRIARTFLSGYLRFPNYRNNFLRMGFTPDDLENEGSDRLVDAIVCWGGEADFRRRIQEHLDAGADQVALQILPREGRVLSPEDEAILEALAPGTWS